MRLLGRNKLTDFKAEGKAEAYSWLSAWASEIAHAHWGSASDLLEQYPKACELQNDIFEFQIGTTGLLVTILVSFPHRMVFIKEFQK